MSGDPIILKKPEHGISRRNIDPDALRILFRLHSLGFTAYLTGGAVRDMMLGKIPKDFDIVTDARPGQIKKYFPRVFIIGRRFRLAHIHFRDGKIIEVATFRKNPVPDAPRGDVALQTGTTAQSVGPAAPAAPPDEKFVESIYGSPREDAFRRDITINALFYDAVATTVIDYVGGVADLRQRRIRIIGAAGERFREDAVRIWRVVRYASRAGFAIDADSEREIAGQRHLLALCSGARLFEELAKDLSYAETRLVIAGLREFGILRHIIGRAGADYENDPDLAARLLHLLAQADGEKAQGGSIALDEMAAILFWPWLEPLFAAEPGDMHPLLKKAFVEADMQVNLPKSLRAQVIEILVLAGRMIRALGNGRMRWSLRERPQYAPAARLCFLIAKDRMPGKEESFESLFREAFPKIPIWDRRQRPRRRRRG